MTGQTPNAGSAQRAQPNLAGSALRAQPTGNPYAPPVTMMRPMQGYQPQNNVQQAPQGNYAYQSQYVAPIQRPQPQWAMPQTYEMPAYTPPPVYDQRAAFEAGMNPGDPANYNPPA